MSEVGSPDIHEQAPPQPSREKREVTPFSSHIQQSQDFRRILGEYKTGLNAAVDSGLIRGDMQQKFQGLRAAFSEKEHADFGPDKKESLTRESKEVYKWFQENFGGAAKLLRDVTPEEQQSQLHELVSSHLVRLYDASQQGDLRSRKQEQNGQLVQMADFFLHESPAFAGVQELMQKEALTLDAQTWAENEDVLDTLVTVAQANKEIALLAPEAADTALKEWVGTMATEARSGVETTDGELAKRKVYETPHYSHLLQEVRRMSRRRNGVGGAILYGPPGTGKTELIREKNRQEGYATHVINIHRYTSFADLMAEKAISVQGDFGGPLAAKLDTVINRFKESSPEQFGQSMRAIYEELHATGKAGESLGEFLLPHISLQGEGIIDLLAKDQFAPEDWGKIQQAFLDKQQTRVLRTALNATQQEVPEDIIRGEILLALRKSREGGKNIRILLDEVDKAGPGSLGGLLSFLAKSPGESITIGDTTEKIPSWFIVDATSNDAELDSYLLDRFTGLHVDTPPAKDQLMIASVRLSDKEGNLKISGYEQEQLGAFFMHALPRVNTLLTKSGQAPISNRGIQELTSNLVDFTNMERTSMPVSEAIKRLVVENRAWKSDEQLAESLRSLLDDEFGMLMMDSPVAIKRRRQAQKQPDQDTAAARQPLFKTVTGLLEQEQLGSVQVEELFLDEGQRAAIHHAFNEEKEQEKNNKVKARFLPTGQVLILREHEGKNQIGLVTAEQGRQLHKLSEKFIEHTGRIAGSSVDGSVVALVSAEQDVQRVTIVEPFVSEKVSASPKTLPHGEVALDKTGNYLGNLTETGELTILKAKELSQEKKLSNVAAFDFSPDGRHLVIKSRDGKTELRSSATLLPILEGPLDIPASGYDWQFVGEHILVQVAQDGSSVQESALFIG